MIINSNYRVYSTLLIIINCFRHPFSLRSIRIWWCRLSESLSSQLATTHKEYFWQLTIIVKKKKKSCLYNYCNSSSYDIILQNALANVLISGRCQHYYPNVPNINRDICNNNILWKKLDRDYLHFLSCSPELVMKKITLYIVKFD